MWRCLFLHFITKLLGAISWDATLFIRSRNTKQCRGKKGKQLKKQITIMNAALTNKKLHQHNAQYSREQHQLDGFGFLKSHHTGGDVGVRHKAIKGLCQCIYCVFVSYLHISYTWKVQSMLIKHNLWPFHKCCALCFSYRNKWDGMSTPVGFEINVPEAGQTLRLVVQGLSCILWVYRTLILVKWLWSKTSNQINCKLVLNPSGVCLGLRTSRFSSMLMYMRTDIWS